MKSAAKGNLWEKEVLSILEFEGWKTFRQHKKIQGLIQTPKGMFPRMVGSDIFGCDIIAKKFGERTKWIQVSTVANKAKKEEQLSQHPWTLEHESPELWLRIHGKKQFRVFEVIAHTIGTELEFKEVESKSCPKSKN